MSNKIVPFIGSRSCTTIDDFRETGEVAIKIPALPHPKIGEIQQRLPRIAYITRDLSPIDAVTMKFAKVLREEEHLISAHEYKDRIASRRSSLLGYQHALWLDEHMGQFPELMDLRGKIYIHFSGLDAIDRDGCEVVFSLYEISGRWDLGEGFSGDNIGRRVRIAFSGE